MRWFHLCITSCLFVRANITPMKQEAHRGIPMQVTLMHRATSLLSPMNDANILTVDSAARPPPNHSLKGLQLRVTPSITMLQNYLQRLL